jgi:hypothetical protein
MPVAATDGAGAATAPSHHYSYSITRRELEYHKAWKSSARSPVTARNALLQAYTEDGNSHRGHDCFIFPRILVSQLEFGDVTIGYSPWGCMLSAVLHTFGDFRVQTNRKWTFHFGVLDALPNVSPVTDRDCAESLELHDIGRYSPGHLLKDDDFSFVGQEPGCVHRQMVGMCCKSCGRVRTECNWQQAYDQSRGEQTYRNWVQTLGNTLSSLDALKTMAPATVDRCCSVSQQPASVYDELKRHWSNTKCDISQGCCISAGLNFGNLPVGELLHSWCRANWWPSTITSNGGAADPRDTNGTPRSLLHAATNAEPKPRRPIVLLFHEDLPSTFKGGNSRVLQLVEWLSTTYQVVVITRTAPPGANCTAQHPAAAPTTSADATRATTALQTRAFGVFNLRAWGATVVEDDVCLTRTFRALPNGNLTDSIPALADVKAIVSTLWFYRKHPLTGLSVPSIPELLIGLLGGVDQGGDRMKSGHAAVDKMRQQLPLHLVVSDDLHYHRAELISTQRDNVAGHTAAILQSELAVYSSHTVHQVFAVTDEDAAAIAALCTKHRRPAPHRPPLMLPYLSQHLTVAAAGRTQRAPKTKKCASANTTGSRSTHRKSITPLNLPFQERSLVMYVGSGSVNTLFSVSVLHLSVSRFCSKGRVGGRIIV